MTLFWFVLTRIAVVLCGLELIYAFLRAFSRANPMQSWSKYFLSESTIGTFFALFVITKAFDPAFLAKEPGQILAATFTTTFFYYLHWHYAKSTTPVTRRKKVKGWISCFGKETYFEGNPKDLPNLSGWGFRHFVSAYVPKKYQIKGPSNEAIRQLIIIEVVRETTIEKFKMCLKWADKIFPDGLEMLIMSDHEQDLKTAGNFMQPDREGNILVRQAYLTYQNAPSVLSSELTADDDPQEICELLNSDN